MGPSGQGDYNGKSGEVGMSLFKLYNLHNNIVVSFTYFI